MTADGHEHGSEAGRWITTASGCRVFVRVAEPAVTELAPPLVLLHGAWEASAVWSRIWADVNQGRRLLAPDLPGHGRSAGSGRPPSLREQGEVVAELLAGEGLQEVDLLTHGPGGSVGAELLARDLEGRPGPTIRRRVVLNWCAYPSMADLGAAHAVGAALSGGDPGSGAGDPDPGAPWREEQCGQAGRWRRAVETHPSPLGVVWGDADPVAGIGMALRLRQARPTLDWVRLPGVGHHPMLAVPSSVARATLDVLS